MLRRCPRCGQSFDGHKEQRLCPECRERAQEERCPSCGRPASQWGEGAVNPAFDPGRFEKLKGGGGE